MVFLKRDINIKYIIYINYNYYYLIYLIIIILIIIIIIYINYNYILVMLIHKKIIYLKIYCLRMIRYICDVLIKCVFK